MADILLPYHVIGGWKYAHRFPAIEMAPLAVRTVKIIATEAKSPNAGQYPIRRRGANFAVKSTGGGVVWGREAFATYDTNQ